MSHKSFSAIKALSCKCVGGPNIVEKSSAKSAKQYLATKSNTARMAQRDLKRVGKYFVLVADSGIRTTCVSFRLLTRFLKKNISKANNLCVDNILSFYMYGYMHVSMYVYMYVCMDVCMYVCM